MNEKKPYKLTFSFQTDKAKIAVLKLLKKIQPATGDELRGDILNQVLNDEDFQSIFRASVDHFTMELLMDKLIEGNWRKEEKRAVKEYSITSDSLHSKDNEGKI